MQPLPRRRPRVLRLLPPHRPGPGASTPAASPQAGRRRCPAGARGRAAQGRLVAAADRGAAGSGKSRRAAGRRPAARPSTATSAAPEGREDGLCRRLPKARRRRGAAATAEGPRGASIPRGRRIENRPAGVGTREAFGHREAGLLIFRPWTPPAPQGLSSSPAHGSRLPPSIRSRRPRAAGLDEFRGPAPDHKDGLVPPSEDRGFRRSRSDRSRHPRLPPPQPVEALQGRPEPPGPTRPGDRPSRTRLHAAAR